MTLNGFKVNIERLVARLGRDVIIRTITNSGPAYDPIQTEVDVTVSAAVFDYNASEIDGSIIQMNDKQFVIASDATVTKQDKIVDGGLVYNIINLEQVQPGSSLLMYIAQGRA